MALRAEIIGIEKLHLTAKGMKEARAKIAEGIKREAEDFANRTLARIREEYLSGPRPDKLGVVSGQLRARTGFRIVNESGRTSVVFGNPLPYAARHEFGDKTPVSIRVTRRMRNWAWWKFKETGDDKYKAMALTKKSAFKQKMKARPFLRPAIKDELPGFNERILEMLHTVASEAVSFG